jgi:hypothetical protein
VTDELSIMHGSREPERSDKPNNAKLNMLSRKELVARVQELEDRVGDLAVLLAKIARK